MRRLINEEELLEVLEKYNFQNYFFEEMTMEEQIDLFSDAEIVIGPHGAGFANILFSKNILV